MRGRHEQASRVALRAILDRRYARWRMGQHEAITVELGALRRGHDPAARSLLRQTKRVPPLNLWGSMQWRMASSARRARSLRTGRTCGQCVASWRRLGPKPDWRAL